MDYSYLPIILILLFFFVILVYAYYMLFIFKSKPEEKERTKNDLDHVAGEKDFLNSIIDTAKLIILVLDTEGRIVRFNKYMEDLSGYSLDEVMGKDWFSTFIPDIEQNRVKDIFSGSLHDKRVKGNLNPIIIKNGEQRIIEWRDNVLKDENGKVTSIVAFGQDVTDRVKAELELALKIEDLEKVNKAMIGRELRVIDLKKRVNSLLEEMGKEREYDV